MSETDNNAPQPGDIWKECDSRFTRYVKVRSVCNGAVIISNCEENGEPWDSMRATTAKAARFHGKHGGYRLHRRTP